MNTEKRLYLACKALLTPWAEDTAAASLEAERQAGEAMAEYEMSLGPIPEWAVAHNITDELVPGLQLFTKDGRNIGNAHITLVTTPPEGCTDVYYHILTDAGNEVRFSLREVNDWFYPGKFISDPDALVKRFGGK